MQQKLFCDILINILLFVRFILCYSLRIERTLISSAYKLHNNTYK